MTIPVKSIVNVSITIGASFPSRKGFGIFNLVTAETGVIGFTERIRSYGSAAAVAADWPSTSEVVAAANTYFAQDPKPTEFKVSVRAAADVAAEVLGGTVVDNPATIAAISAITDGTFTISIDGNSENLVSMDFSTDADMLDVAATIQTTLQAIVTAPFATSTVVYDGAQLVITSGTVGAASTVSFATATGSGTDVGALLNLQQGQAAKSDGVAGETITEALDAIEAVSAEWYGLGFTKEVRDAVVVNTENAVLAAAAWVQARVKVFFNTSNNLAVLDGAISSDIISAIKATSSTRTMSLFSSVVDQYPCASIAGRAFTVDFSQPASVITLKFKRMPTILAEDFTESQKAVLDSKRGNAAFNIGPSGAIFGEGFMAADLFFDEVHGTDWLADAVQTEVYGYMAGRPTRVPYTDAGTAALEQQVVRVLDEAARNGLIAAGTTVAGVFLPNGYSTSTVSVSAASASDKTNRQYNGLSFIALGAGSIHGAQVQGVFER
jgi:hypothetical protein